MAAEDPSNREAPRAIAPPWLARLVHWQDEAFRIPGTGQEVGFDAIVGFVLPGVGDLASAALSMVVVLSAVRHGVPVRVLLLMVFNILLDTLVGALPILGDVFDVAFKANRKNLELFERHGQAEVVQGGAGRLLRALLLFSAGGLALVFVSATVALSIGFFWGSYFFSG